MAAKPEPVTIANAPLPKCCDNPEHSVNFTQKTCLCLRCKAEHVFDKLWVNKPAEAQEAPAKK